MCSSIVLCSYNCVAGSNYEFIIAEIKGDRKSVGVITLNRPKALNALCDGLMKEVSDVVEKFENDDSVGALVITGSEKAFAAGKQPN
jgi:Enoyl-CoA hydratase/carnithine racemase